MAKMDGVFRSWGMLEFFMFDIITKPPSTRLDNYESLNNLARSSYASKGVL